MVAVAKQTLVSCVALSHWRPECITLARLQLLCLMCLCIMTCPSESALEVVVLGGVYLSRKGRVPLCTCLSNHTVRDRDHLLLSWDLLEKRCQLSSQVLTQCTDTCTSQQVNTITWSGSCGPQHWGSRHRFIGKLSWVYPHLQPLQTQTPISTSLSHASCCCRSICLTQAPLWGNFLGDKHHRTNLTCPDLSQDPYQCWVPFGSTPVNTASMAAGASRARPASLQRRAGLSRKLPSGESRWRLQQRLAWHVSSLPLSSSSSGPDTTTLPPQTPLACCVITPS